MTSKLPTVGAVQLYGFVSLAVTKMVGLIFPFLKKGVGKGREGNAGVAIVRGK